DRVARVVVLDRRHQRLDLRRALQLDSEVPVVVDRGHHGVLAAGRPPAAVAHGQLIGRHQPIAELTRSPSTARRTLAFAARPALSWASARRPWFGGRHATTATAATMTTPEPADALCAQGKPQRLDVASEVGTGRSLRPRNGRTDRTETCVAGATPDASRDFARAGVPAGARFGMVSTSFR